MTEYVHPEVLVSTDWVAEHANDPNVRIVESDEDVLLYDVGHVPGAIKVDWHTELQHHHARQPAPHGLVGRPPRGGRGGNGWSGGHACHRTRWS